MAPRVYALAPDGGWGWMVVVAGFVQSALVFGIIRSFGVFFVEFVVYFRESSGTVSWVMSLGVTGLHLASKGEAFLLRKKSSKSLFEQL